MLKSRGGVIWFKETSLDQPALWYKIQHLLLTTTGIRAGGGAKPIIIEFKMLGGGQAGRQRGEGRISM